MEIKTVCPRDCPDSCFMTVTVEDGKITSIRGDDENPITRGFTCPRGAAEPERTYSKDRVLYPHVRTDQKPGMSFRKVSWDEALDRVTTALRQTFRDRGPGKVLHLDYAGNTGLFSYLFSQRLWYAVGATMTDSSLCSSSGHAALSLHYGLSYGFQPEDLLKMRVITFWGFNARVSSPHLWALALRAGEKGATIAVIDPRRTEMAEEADVWLSPRPGSDVALAYGISRFLIEGGYVDLDFIGDWTRGFEAFREEAMTWTPGRVEDVTRVPWSHVESLAEVYGRNPPSAVMIGIGLQKSLCGAESVRAVSLIPAILSQHRGFYYTNSMGRLFDLGYVTGETLTRVKPDVVSQVALGKLLEAGMFGFIYINGMNPAVSLPDQGVVRKGLSRDDVFVVVHDTHWTATAGYADVVLPALTYLEKDDLVVSDSHPYFRRASRAVDPLGESKWEIWVMRELAGRLGLQEGWMFEDPWDAVERSSERAFEEGSFRDLLNGSTLKLRSRARDEYQTPTGRVEFYSEKAKELGFSPLPSQLRLPDVEDQYILLTSAVPRYTHSQFQDVYGPIPPLVWLNAADAEAINVREGDTVALSNELGVIEVRAVVNDRVQRGILWSPRLLAGLNGEPQNLIFPSNTQAIGGGPMFNSTTVRVRTTGVMVKRI